MSTAIDGVATTYDYDSYHRPVKETREGTSVSYTYDDYNRVKTEYRTIDASNTLGFTYNYNAQGLLQSTVYPGNVTVGYAYDGYGNLTSVTAGNIKVWEFASNNGLRYTATLGGTLTSVEERNSQGLLTSQQVTKGSAVLHNMGYTFNGSTGNLTSRSGMLSQTETFGYDNVDRLTSVQHGSTTAMTLTYGANGNITSKTGIGTYSYGTKPHAVTSVSNSGSLIDSNTQSITYTAFDKAASISQGYYRLDITYGTDLQRWKSVLKNNGTVTRTTLYAGDYEKVTENGVIRQYYYLHGDNGLAALYVKQSNASDKVYYPCTDHLGSIMKLVDANGTESFKAAYDAWGQQTVTTNTLNFHRGYTGHEHLSQFALINMNGRMYDPLLGRFLSPDPFVQLPDFSQNFNRYSYCLNNPLVYTDPSGKLFVIDDLIMSAVIGATINIATQAITGNIDSFGDIFLAAGIGGVSGVVSYATGQIFTNVLNGTTIMSSTILGNSITNSMSAFTGAYILGAGNSWMNGDNFFEGIKNGIFLGVTSGLISGGFSALSSWEQYKSTQLIFKKGCSVLNVNEEEILPATDDFLIKAQKVWYPEAPMDNIKTFTVEKVPDKVQAVMDANKAAASTRAISKNGILTGRSSVYFNKQIAFKNAKNLFYTMGHEFLHVSQYSSLVGLSKAIIANVNPMLDLHAYNYEIVLGNKIIANSYSREELLAFPQEYFKITSHNNYKWTKNVNFKYPL